MTAALVILSVLVLAAAAVVVVHVLRLLTEMRASLDKTRQAVSASKKVPRDIAKLGDGLKGIDKRLRALEQTRFGQLARLDYPNAELLIGATTRSELLTRTRPHHKEPWTVEWIERFAGPDEVLYDIGANIGAYSLIAASLPTGGASVVAIEPAYANYASLCDNIVLNGLGDRVTPLPLVLGAASELDTLDYSDVEPGAALHSLESTEEAPSASERAPVAYRQPVLAYSLDDLIARFGLPAPTLIKLDVDGAETAVLSGGRATFSDTRLRSLLLEVDDRQTDEIMRLLAETGLELERRIEERNGQPMHGLWYGVFVRP